MSNELHTTHDCMTSHQIRSPVRPVVSTLLYHTVYVPVWLLVTPNSSMITGLFALAWDVWWSVIHWVPKPVGSLVWPQLT